MKLAVALAVLVFLLPAVQATALASASGASSAACAAAPCGYITPIVDMQFDSKPKCSGSAATVDLTKCIPLPDKGKSISFEGTFHYTWKESEDLTYPPDPQQAVQVSFSGVSTNPKWLTFKIEPATLTIDAVALLDPRNLCPDMTTPATPVVYYCYTAPIKVTFTHSGDPDAAALQKIKAKGGVAEVFLKAKSGQSGQYFKEGFGVESFRFDAHKLLPTVATTTKASPAGGLLAPLLAFALAGLVTRRRS